MEKGEREKSCPLFLWKLDPSLPLLRRLHLVARLPQEDLWGTNFGAQTPAPAAPCSPQSPRASGLCFHLQGNRDPSGQGPGKPRLQLPSLPFLGCCVTSLPSSAGILGAASAVRGHRGPPNPGRVDVPAMWTPAPWHLPLLPTFSFGGFGGSSSDPGLGSSQVPLRGEHGQEMQRTQTAPALPEAKRNRPAVGLWQHQLLSPSEPARGETCGTEGLKVQTETRVWVCSGLSTGLVSTRVLSVQISAREFRSRKNPLNAADDSKPSLFPKAHGECYHL